MLTILRIFNRLSPTSAPYVQFTLGFKNVKTLAITLLNPTSLDINKNVAISSYNNPFKFLYLIIQSTQKYTNAIVHIHNPILLPVVFLCKNKKIFTLHTNFNLLKKHHKIILALCLYGLNKIVCCSESVYKSLPKKYAHNSRFTFINNGANITKLYEKFNTLDSLEFDYVVIGRLNSNKDPEFILENIDIPNKKIAFIGAGPLQAGLKLKYTSENIRFFSQVPRDSVFGIACRSKIFISASNGEGLPIAVLEALGLGLICVISDIPGHKILRNLKHLGIFIFSKEKVNSFETILKEATKFYADNNRKDIFLKRNKILHKYSIENMEAKYTELYNQL